MRVSNNHRIAPTFILVFVFISSKILFSIRKSLSYQQRHVSSVHKTCNVRTCISQCATIITWALSIHFGNSVENLTSKDRAAFVKLTNGLMQLCHSYMLYDFETVTVNPFHNIFSYELRKNVSRCIYVFSVHHLRNFAQHHAHNF